MRVNRTALNASAMETVQLTDVEVRRVAKAWHDLHADPRQLSAYHGKTLTVRRDGGFQLLRAVDDGSACSALALEGMLLVEDAEASPANPQAVCPACGNRFTTCGEAAIPERKAT